VVALPGRPSERLGQPALHRPLPSFWPAHNAWPGHALIDGPCAAVTSHRPKTSGTACAPWSQRAGRSRTIPPRIPVGGCGAAITAQLQESGSGHADRPLEVAAPLEVGGHLRSSQLVQGAAVAPGRPKRTARPLGDLQALLPFPATGRQRNQGGAKVGHPIHQDRPGRPRHGRPTAPAADPR